MDTIQWCLYTHIFCSELFRNLWGDDTHLKGCSAINLYLYLLTLFVFIEELVELVIVLVWLDVLLALFEVLGVLLVLGLLGLGCLLGCFSVDWYLFLFTLVMTASRFLAIRDGDLIVLVSRGKGVRLRNIGEILSENLV